MDDTAPVFAHRGRTLARMNPAPGDFGLSPGGGWAMAAVRWGTGVPVFKYGRLFRRPAKYGHAAVCVGHGPSPAEVMIVEATPAGVIRRNVLTTHFDWSTGGPLDDALTPDVRTLIVLTATNCLGKGYDWPSILGFIPRWAWSRYRGRDQEHPDDKLICSELVVWSWRTAGVVGMLDGRAPGSIAPVDLAVFLPR